MDDNDYNSTNIFNETSTESSMDKSESLHNDSEDKMNPCYITVENDDGHLEQLQIDVDDNQFTVYPGFLKNLPSSPLTSDEPSSDNSNNYNYSINPFKKKKKRKFETNKHLKRIIAKGGSCNIAHINVPKKKRLYFQDIFTTMIDMSWRYTFIAFASSFFVTWLLFACIWISISWLHGDLNEGNSPKEGYANGTWIPCILGINNFASAFLFSIETEHTIGYGTRSTTEECPHAIILMCLQSMIGVLFSSCMTGVVFAKLARPKYRVNTVIFSKNAVITLKNERLYLLFRLSNIRKSHILNSNISAKLIHRNKYTKEGFSQQYYSEDLKLSTSLELADEDKPLTLFPTVVSHRIDEKSPFYDLGPKEVLRYDFELVVFLEGIIEPTGNSFQARTSYLPREIQWGMRFEEMISYINGRYTVDISYLNAIVPDNTPRLSMKDLTESKNNEYQITLGKKIKGNNTSIITISLPDDKRQNLSLENAENKSFQNKIKEMKKRKKNGNVASRFSMVPISNL